MLALIVGLGAGWWIGVDRPQGETSRPSLRDPIPDQTIEGNKAMSDEERRPNDANKSANELATLRSLNLVIKRHLGKIEEINSSALEDVRKYYLKFDLDEVDVSDLAPLQQALISRIERAEERWPELDLCPNTKGEQIMHGNRPNASQSYTKSPQ